MKKTLIITIAAFFLFSCTKGPDRQSFKISGTIQLYHPTNVPSLGGDISASLPNDVCDVLGILPENGEYGTLSISLDVKNIPAVINDHAFNGTFGDRASIFDEGDASTQVVFLGVPGGGFYAIMDKTNDGPFVLLSLKGPLENGTIELNQNVPSLQVLENDQNSESGCVHAIGIGNLTISD